MNARPLFQQAIAACFEIPSRPSIRSARIRFRGGADQRYAVVLGPQEADEPQRLQFRGGEELDVDLRPSGASGDAYELRLSEGRRALEVSADYFDVI
ncbi:hypothetical protein [Blastopirellula marina]|uniref:Uncharacterized protein n=1 Tax=Blastopirellula marina TaxID=124 RepID=A0A2S8GGL9_9BACT|nr:hypothetical protein [Blastopirellula marina]PQO40097.1 hypothetical protein C5Y98_07240 [Blastopirellula marina]PQO43612.1 hypothetical protein C5Y93_23500 [Blastopirellula marina]PTL45472.1 hypothetical protein C5Y97_07240 [Blastopirellula marina]